MIIAVDQTPLTTGHKGRGVGQYTRFLLDALRKYQPDHTYLPFTKADPVPPEAEVIHYPYFDPFFRTLPLLKRKPTVVTVHDLIPLVFPDTFPPGKRGSFVWQMQRISLRWSSRIIADSNTTKQDIMRIVGFPEAKIDVIPLAPSPLFGPVTDKTKLAAAQKTYHLPSRYLLYVGDVNWNKNISGLVRIFKKLTEKDRTVHLVLVGSAFIDEDLREAKDIDMEIHELGLRDRVIRTGRIPDEDLSAVYSRALAYIQPSYYEGFGFPVLEAMACGCPVVTSDAASLSEIAGPSKTTDIRNVAQTVSVLKTVLAMRDTERTAWIQKGISYARSFSWSRVAQETVSSYQRSLRKQETTA